jgi:hypothetical protein
VSLVAEALRALSDLRSSASAQPHRIAVESQVTVSDGGVGAEEHPDSGVCVCVGVGVGIGPDGGLDKMLYKYNKTPCL